MHTCLNVNRKNKIKHVVFKMLTTCFLDDMFEIKKREAKGEKVI